MAAPGRPFRTAAALVVAALVFVPPSAASAAELYRWVDPAGTVFFSDKPPPDLPPEAYEGPRPKTVREALEEEAEARRAAAVAERTARQRAARERTLASPPASEQASAPPDDIEIESEYDCEQARRFHDHYRTIDKPLYRTTPEGGFRRVTPEELAEQVGQWEEAVRLLCREPKPSAES